MKNQKRWLPILLVILLLACCGEKVNTPENTETFKTESVTLNVKECRLADIQSYEQHLGGVSEEKGEFYVFDYVSEREEDNICVRVVNIETGELSSTWRLKRGDRQSPDEFKEIIPSVKFFKDRYFVFGNKVAAFDDNFNFKFSSFFKADKWEFVDYILYEGKTHFLLGNSIDKFDSRRFEVLLYELKETSRSVKKSILFAIDVDLSGMKNTSEMDPLTKKRRYNVYYFRPKPFGFVKKGNIFYSVNTKNGYYIYNPGENKTRFIELSFLKQKKYTDEDAKRIGLYRTQDFNEKFKSGSRFFYKASSLPVYFLWMLDAGTDKIAFIGGIDTKQMTARFDILHAETGSYIGSVNLPVGQHFAAGMKMYRPSFPQIHLLYDKGIYLWGERVSEDWLDMLMFSKITIIAGTKPE